MDLSLNRVILFVQNVERLKHFYQQNFQFELAEEIKDNWVVLKAGKCELALHKAGAAFEGNSSILDPGTNNVKLVFETAGELSAIREDLLRNKVQMKEIKSFPGFTYLSCDGHDTEGNVFQLVQVRP